MGALEIRERRAAGLFALGFTGLVDAVEACLRHLDDRSTARWAVEAISHVTGLPLEDDRFAKPSSRAGEDEGQEGPTAEDQLEQDLTLAPTEGLPDPEAASIRAWWAARRASFDPALRYLRGRPLSPATLEEACGSWPLRRFGGVAIEIVVRSGGAAVVEPLRLGYPRLTLPAGFASLLANPPSWR
jgi:uncharacterized protein (TIGR02270 family)